jgi:hypothetical protein
MNKEFLRTRAQEIVLQLYMNGWIGVGYLQDNGSMSCVDIDIDGIEHLLEDAWPGTAWEPEFGDKYLGFPLTIKGEEMARRFVNDPDSQALTYL